MKRTKWQDPDPNFIQALKETLVNPPIRVLVAFVDPMTRRILGTTVCDEAEASAIMDMPDSVMFESHSQEDNPQ
jgi:hypothetical protein